MQVQVSSDGKLHLYAENGQDVIGAAYFMAGVAAEPVKSADKIVIDVEKTDYDLKDLADLIKLFMATAGGKVEQTAPKPAAKVKEAPQKATEAPQTAAKVPSDTEAPEDKERAKEIRAQLKALGVKVGNRMKLPDLEKRLAEFQEAGEPEAPEAPEGPTVKEEPAEEPKSAIAPADFKKTVVRYHGIWKEAEGCDAHEMLSAILTPLGYPKLSDVKEKDFAAVLEGCTAAEKTRNADDSGEDDLLA